MRRLLLYSLGEEVQQDLRQADNHGTLVVALLPVGNRGTVEKFFNFGLMRSCQGQGVWHLPRQRPDC